MKYLTRFSQCAIFVLVLLFLALTLLGVQSAIQYYHTTYSNQAELGGFKELSTTTAVEEQKVLHSTYATVIICSGGGHGTGWYISEDLIVTAAHVVERNRFNNTEVIMFNDDNELLKGDVVEFNTERDVALVKLRYADKRAKTVAVDNESMPKNGDDVILVGNGGDNIDLVVLGKVITRYYIDSMKVNSDVYLIEMKSIGGHSGGPVFNKDGKVIGVLSMGNGTHSLVIPIKYALDLLDKYNKVDIKVVDTMED